MNFPRRIRFTNVFAFKTFRDILEKERPNCKWTPAIPLHGWTPPSWAYPMTIIIDGNSLHIESYEGYRNGR